MPARKFSVVIAFCMLLVGGQVRIGLTGQARLQGKNSSSVTEVLRVIGKGTDHIVVGEQRLYVVPEVTKLASSYGTAIELSRLRTPCLAEVTYVRWLEGVEKHPVVLHLKVKRVYRGASSKDSREEEVVHQ